MVGAALSEPPGDFTNDEVDRKISMLIGNLDDEEEDQGLWAWNWDWWRNVGWSNMWEETANAWKDINEGVEQSAENVREWKQSWDKLVSDQQAKREEEDLRMDLEELEHEHLEEDPNVIRVVDVERVEMRDEALHVKPVDVGRLDGIVRRKKTRAVDETSIKQRARELEARLGQRSRLLKRDATPPILKRTKSPRPQVSSTIAQMCSKFEGPKMQPDPNLHESIKDNNDSLSQTSSIFGTGVDPDSAICKPNIQVTPYHSRTISAAGACISEQEIAISDVTQPPATSSSAIDDDNFLSAEQNVPGSRSPIIAAKTKTEFIRPRAVKAATLPETLAPSSFGGSTSALLSSRSRNPDTMHTLSNVDVSQHDKEVIQEDHEALGYLESVRERRRLTKSNLSELKTVNCPVFSSTYDYSVKSAFPQVAGFILV